MAKTMKAALVREFKKPLSIDEVGVPEVGEGQILVKIEASGVCHTDLMRRTACAHLAHYRAFGNAQKRGNLFIAKGRHY